MKRIVCYTSFLFILLFFCNQFAASQRFAAKRFRGKKSKEYKITIDQKERTYHLFVPSDSKEMAPNKKLPFVFVLHGGGRSGRSQKAQQLERFTKFSALAEKEGFIVCYPEGYQGNWNDGRGVEGIPAHKENIDDVKFFREIVKEVSKKHQVDQSRIFSTGISNGGFMSHRLAAEASDMIAAIAPLVGGMAEPIAKKFKPKYPVSLFIIQGDSDPLVPIDGGEVGYKRGKKRGKVISTNDAIAKYVKHNSIQGKPTKTTLKDKAPNDGTTTQKTVYPPSKEGVKVQLYVIKNGGHTWPGRPLYAPEFFIGKVSKDFDATEEIWKFFKSCPPRKK
ncbi:hypothetical protein MNBD_PLANCTO02-501 [hydrothermal vent metagenome]|uniref:LpqC n=1 Tax=hydrothermal vent metagenome TaxID=652676 RepID=A0A3B1E5F9_9ZZZZ